MRWSRRLLWTADEKLRFQDDVSYSAGGRLPTEPVTEASPGDAASLMGMLLFYDSGVISATS